MRPYKAHWIKNPGRRLHPARQKAIPLSRCARVRFAPPFIPKGEDRHGTPYFEHPLRPEEEDKHGTPYFEHPLRDEGGRREAPGDAIAHQDKTTLWAHQAIVTNSSADVGWIATVRRKSA